MICPCLLCQEARKLTRMRLDKDYIVMVYDGWDMMSISRKFFENLSIRQYEEVAEDLLFNPRKDWRLK